MTDSEDEETGTLSYVDACQRIDAIVAEYFGSFSHRWVMVASGIDMNADVLQKIFIPNGQLYTDTVGQLDYGLKIMDIEIRTNYINQRYFGRTED